MKRLLYPNASLLRGHVHSCLWPEAKGSVESRTVSESPGQGIDLYSSVTKEFRGSCIFLLLLLFNLLFWVQLCVWDFNFGLSSSM